MLHPLGSYNDWDLVDSILDVDKEFEGSVLDQEIYLGYCWNWNAAMVSHLIDGPLDINGLLLHGRRPL